MQPCNPVLPSYSWYVSQHSTGVSLRFGAWGHLDLAPGQSLCKALKVLKIYSGSDAKSSQAKLSSQPVNLPSARLLMKPLILWSQLANSPSSLFVNPQVSAEYSNAGLAHAQETFALSSSGMLWFTSKLWIFFPIWILEYFSQLIVWIIYRLIIKQGFHRVLKWD
mgnify:CR=1 FL=1